MIEICNELRIQMKQTVLFFCRLTIYLLCITPNVSAQNIKNNKKTTSGNSLILKDTCIIVGHTFKMIDYKSTKKLKAFIKNSQIFVINQGLQYAKYRVTYYVFSSMDDEQMPSIRHFDQRLSPPVLQVLKDATIGNQFLFEEIVVVDPSKIELTNAVRPILIERIKD